MNEAIGISRLGHSVKLLCGLGEDHAAAVIEDRARKEGINITHVYHGKEGKTHISIPMVHADGEKTIVATGPYAAPFYKPDISLITPAKVVSLASLFRDPFNDLDTLLAVCRKAKENGSIICADVKLNDGKKTFEDIREALPYLDYVFPNEGEARNFTGREDLMEAADVMLEYGIGHAVIKTGKDGCIAKSREETLLIPSYPVEVVDTTGAGDNFAAGFISALVEGKDFRGCCEYAVATGAVAVQTVGGNTAIKNKEQVIALMKKGR